MPHFAATSIMLSPGIASVKTSSALKYTTMGAADDVLHLLLLAAAPASAAAEATRRLDCVGNHAWPPCGWGAGRKAQRPRGWPQQREHARMLHRCMPAGGGCPGC